jgi:transcriptional regulator with XRE-family HTH domain
MAKKAKPTDKDEPAMARVRAVWAQQKSKGMTQEQLGVMMGYDQISARKSISQFLQGHDPRVSMIRRFAKALGVAISHIIRDGD